MLKDITLGQYYPTESPIHSLDPRTKLLLMIAFIVFIFLIQHIWLFLAAALFIVCVTLLSKVPLRLVIKSLKPLRWLLILMFMLNLFITVSGDILLEFWVIKITAGGLRQAVFITLRLLTLVTGTSLLTLTTTPISLTDGIEKLLAPLGRIKFPAHELAMMMTIALRFIPTLLEEADKITKAQLSRGADFETGNIFKRAKGMIPILVPLFVSAFRRADELAMAMESRCYHGGEGRTRMRTLQFHTGDIAAAFLMAAMMAAVILMQNLLH